jgi:hypothetical protein
MKAVYFHGDNVDVELTKAAGKKELLELSNLF